MGELKSEVFATQGIPVFFIKLLLGDQILHSESVKLLDFGVRPGATLDMIISNPSPEEFDRLYAINGGTLIEIQGHLSFSSHLKGLNDERKASLFHAVVADERVNKLTLRCTGLDCRDAAMLANALEQSRVLSVLDVSENFITDVGAGRLAEMFIQTPIMSEMYLFNNRVTHEGKQILHG